MMAERVIMWTTVVGILLQDLTAHDVRRTLNKSWPKNG
jgi:hypothetical protein